MARCMLIESSLPKMLWTYAIQTAAAIRNRCYNRRVGQTPYYMLTGKKPDLSRMKIFGSKCYAYKQNKKKLDSRCEKGIFIGYDKNSPAYLVFYPDSGKVNKSRLVEFLTKSGTECHTQTDQSMCEDDVRRESTETHLPKPEIIELINSQDIRSETCDPGLNTGERERVESRRYPQREKRPPQYLRDYEYGIKCDDDHALTSIDYCYRVACDVPHTLKEAISSPESELWSKAMQEEMNSLKENDTFTLTTLPEGKNIVGGRWVYTVKENPVGTTYKARYVAKGYSQVAGIDYNETFSPTADMTSIRSLMQIAAQYGLELHQMDVKTAYLHAPIDTELYMEQPEGFEVKSETSKRLVCKLNKSLYGLKQSGRNWNKMLDDFLIKNDFSQNPSDHCVYSKQTGGEKIILIVWVDDLLIAASDSQTLRNVKRMLEERFKMKDLGKLTHFLGIDFAQGDGEIKMNQKRSIIKILERFDMINCKPRSTPCENKMQFDNEGERVDPKLYREVVGSVIYLMTCTRFHCQ